ncbi:MAG: glutamate-5-semialdehyde dehydrogenase [Chloroflexi bacterium]|nr:glutamate-5-semialdehyde dehydrogenase [Chloroflexota bacterium]
MTGLDLIDMGRRAKSASVALARATTDEKNALLLEIANALEDSADAIIDANAEDLAEGRANGLSAALLDRLDLQKRLTGIIADVRHVATLPDPVGKSWDERTLENGLKVSRRRIPLGVLGVIYEARPNVTVEVASLALKTGNASILRGGKETLRSNVALVAAIQRALASCGFPADGVQLIASTDRAYVGQMLKMHQYIDVLIPRGGNSLHQFCRENSTIPVITGGIGICHLFVDETADQDKAIAIIDNARTSRPSVCNSADTALVHRRIANTFLPKLVTALRERGVSFKADPRALQIVGDIDGVEPAGPDDFDTEWMALVLGLKVVDSLDEAVEHIRAHSLDHSDGILTRDLLNAERFVNEVNSSAVFVNASTRFNDGGALGLGAEVAVSTQKLHARGPMALEELTTYKWVVQATVRCAGSG